MIKRCIVMKKTNFARLLAGILAFTLLLLFAGCSKPAASPSNSVSSSGSSSSGPETPDPPKPIENVTIRVGTQPSTVGTPLDYALKNNLFDGTGITVERILFPTGAPINEAIAAEQLDIALNGLATVYAVAAGDVIWIGEINSASGLNIYVRPDSPILEHKGELADYPNTCGSADTMKGLTIVGPLGTSAQFNAITWMGCFGLSATDYQMLHMDHGPAYQAFISGEGDAIASSPPYTYELDKAGMIPVAPLEEVSGITLMDGVCVRKEYLEENRSAVKAFMEVIYEVQEILGNDDKIVYDVCMEYYNENGRETDDNAMNSEILERDFVDKEIMSDPDYRFGSVIIGMGNFYVDDGKIDPADQPNLVAGLDPTILEEIYGLDIKIYGE